MKDNYPNAYAEVYTILSYLEEEEYKKIPSDILVRISVKRNTEYNYELNEDLDLTKQPMLPETKSILFNIFRDYLATPEQKEKILTMQNEEKQKAEKQKQPNFDVDVFAKRRQEKEEEIKKAIQEAKEEQEELALTEYKESFFDKIVNYFKKLFKH